MSPPQFEVDLLAARDAFEEAAAKSAPALREAGGRYIALLDEYLGGLRRGYSSAPAPWPGQTYARPGSLGAATKMAFQDSAEWARAERGRVEARIAADEKKGGKK
jgi:hypothetical protein